jgi:hypothetical protein
VSCEGRVGQCRHSIYSDSPRERAPIAKEHIRSTKVALVRTHVFHQRHKVRTEPARLCGLCSFNKVFVGAEWKEVQRQTVRSRHWCASIASRSRKTRQSTQARRGTARLHVPTRAVLVSLGCRLVRRYEQVASRSEFRLYQAYSLQAAVRQPDFVDTPAESWNVRV